MASIERLTKADDAVNIEERLQVHCREYHRRVGGGSRSGRRRLLWALGFAWPRRLCRICSAGPGSSPRASPGTCALVADSRLPWSNHRGVLLAAHAQEASLG